MTTATFHSNMQAAARAYLQTMPSLPAVAWEGRPYTPVRGTPYISESFRPIASTVVGFGGGTTKAHRCTLNLVLHYPSGVGTKTISDMAGALLDHFDPGTKLSRDGDTAVILQAERTPVQELAPDWTTVAVIITMVGYTTG